MEVTPNQMGKLDEERVNEDARCVSQDDGLLLCERQVYPLCEAIREEDQAANVVVTKANALEQSSITYNRRFMSSGEIPDSE